MPGYPTGPILKVYIGHGGKQGLSLVFGRSDGDEIKLDMTKGQLAAFLGTIPETLSRVFAKLSQSGIIDINGSRITLLNREQLQVLAEGRKI
ncbi:MAG: winged helix-turn-helix domain-containing protein [Hormoscilla sp. GUM202]|nr:winged helix-turn-helix domain-containing protein [Hormoscilla sp. GUM202]